jgi:uncharacterized protein DUF4079
MSATIPYWHPIASVAAIALAAYAASLGLRARAPRADAARARARHAALGPWVYACFVANWLAGVLTLHSARPDIETAASGHFTVGSAIVVVLTAGALLSRRIRVDPRARAVHPLLGALALLLCGFQVFLGLQLLP